MDSKTIFTKTTKGLNEVLGKTKALPRELRRILKEIDGKSSVAELDDRLGNISGGRFLVALTRLNNEDYIREFAAPTNVAEHDPDLDLDLTKIKSQGDRLTALTMGAFLRAQMPKSDSAASSARNAEEEFKKNVPTGEILREPQGMRGKEAVQTRKDTEAAELARTIAEDKARRKVEADRKALAVEYARKENEAKKKAETAEWARAEEEARVRRDAEAERKAQAEEQARREAEQRMQREVDARKKAEAAEQHARREAEEAARRAAAAIKMAEAAEQARREAEEVARREAEAREKAEAEKQAREEAEEITRRDAEAKRLAEAAERGRAEAEEKARRDAEAKREAEAIEQARKKAEEAEQSRREAEEKARREAEAQRKAEVAEQARKQAEAAARREAEAIKRAEAAEKARREAEEVARREAEARRKAEEAEQARKEGEEIARREAEAQRKAEAAERARAEEEARVRRNAEAERKAQAEEQARREAEQRMQREVDARKKAEASEQQARREAEEAARRAAAAIKKAEAAEQARREAEERAQREAEARMKVEAEEQARKEVEAAEQAHREATETAQREAEAKSKAEVAERARVEAEERSRRDAEARRKAEAEEEVRREAEQRAQREAEARKKAETAEQSRKEAEEEIGRNSEQTQQKDEKTDTKQDEREISEIAQLQDEAHVAKDVQLRSQRKPKHKDGVESGQKVERSAEEKARSKTAAPPRQEWDEHASLNGAPTTRIKGNQSAEGSTAGRHTEPRKKPRKEHRAEEVKLKAVQEVEQPSVPIKHEKSYSRPINWGKPVALIIFTLVVAGIFLIQTISFDAQSSQFEQAATAQFQQPVKIGRTYLALLPQPHWRIEGVSVGKQAQVKVVQVDVTPDWQSLFGNKRTYKSIALISADFSEEGLAWLMFGRSQQSDLEVRQVMASNVRIGSQNINLPAFHIDSDIGANGNWKKMVIDSEDKKLHVELKPQDDVVQIELSAREYVTPFGSFVLENFNASGIATPDELKVTSFSSVMLNGVVKGNAKLRWGDSWSLLGELTARQIDATKIAPQLFERGDLELNANFVLRAKSAKQLFSEARLKGNATIRDGVLLRVDLAKFLSGGGGSKSSFTDLDSSFVYDSEKLQLSNVRLRAGLMSANGSAVVDASENLSGSFTVAFKEQSRHMRADITLSGKLNEPHFAR